MPNELILDSKQFGEMVSQWEDGGVYRVELIITQSSNDGKSFKATVDEVTDYGDSEEIEVEDEPVIAPPAPPKKPPGKKTVYPPSEE